MNLHEWRLKFEPLWQAANKARAANDEQAIAAALNALGAAALDDLPNAEARAALHELQLAAGAFFDPEDTLNLDKAHKDWISAAGAYRKAAGSAQETTPLDASASWPEPGEMAWIVKDWLPAGRVALLAGKGGNGKSKLALMLACAMSGAVKHSDSVAKWLEPAASANAAALEVEPDYRESSVVFASWEDNHKHITRRALNWPEAARLAGQQNKPRAGIGELHALTGTPSRLRTVYVQQRGPMWGMPAGAHRAIRASLLPVGRQLLEYAVANNARLLVLDPVAAVFGGNENDRAAVREFMSMLDAFAQEHDCAVLVLAHPPKDKESDFSGSTDWHAASKVLWTFERAGKGGAEDSNAPLELKCVKSNYGPLPRKLHLKEWKWWTLVPPPAKAAGSSGSAGKQEATAGFPQPNFDRSKK